MPNNLIAGEIFILGIILLAIYKNYSNIKQELVLAEILISLAIFLIPIWIFLIYKTYKIIKKKIKDKKEKRELIRKQKEMIEDFLQRNLEKMESEELKELLNKIKSEWFVSEVEEQFKELLEEKIPIGNLILYKKELDNEVISKIQEKDELKQEIKKLEQEKHKREKDLRTNREKILEHLDIEENPVFLIDDLDEKEIKILKEVGFEKINEYDPLFQKNANFLVKQILNHSLTHILLVERIKKILLQYLEEDQIEVHNTRDADITFKFKGRTYAFEIELGSLLRKKVQLEDKVYDLNFKYRNNWYFIVSHKNLLAKYRKHGKSTTRSGVSEIIKKLLESDTYY